MSIVSALEADLDQLTTLIASLFPAIAHNSAAQYSPEVVLQEIVFLDEKIQSKVQILSQRIASHKRMVQLTRKIHENSVHINGFINNARALENAIFSTIAEAPRIRGSVSTNALYATSVSLAYTPNTVPMINPEACSSSIQQTLPSKTSKSDMLGEDDDMNDAEDVRHRVEARAEELLRDLQQPLREPTLATLLRQAATAGEETFPPVGAFANVPMPASLVAPVFVDPTATSLSSLTPAQLLQKIRSRSSDLGYQPSST